MISKQLWACSLLFLHIVTLTPKNIYQPLVQEMTKSIPSEHPTEEQIAFLNLCRAFEQAGIESNLTSAENWQAINSVKTFQELLPKYNRTLTNSGYLALGGMLASFNDDAANLQQKIAIQKYLTSNPEVMRELHNILCSMKPSENTFAHFFRQFTPEEQAELDQKNTQLYFSMPVLNKLNETSLALEIGPRTNQLLSATSVVLPILIASASHKLWATYHSLEDKERETLEKLNEVYQLDHQTKWDSLSQKLKAYKFWDKSKKQGPSEAQQKLQALIKQENCQNIEELTDKYHKQYLKASQDSIDYINSNPRLTWDVSGLKKVIELGPENLPNFFPFLIKRTSKVASNAYQELKTQTCYYKTKADFMQDPYYQKHPNKAALLAGANTVLAVSIIASAIGFIPYYWHTRYKSTKNLLDLIYEKQQDLIALGYALHTMQTLQTTLHKDARLKDLMSKQHTKLTELFDCYNPNTSKDLKSLVNTLMSWSFQGSESYLFSQQGKILATHHLFVRIKDQLVPYFEALGQVDAYLAIAKIYTEFEHHPRVRFCLPEFVNTNRPVLHAHAYWHPYIDPNKVVTNDVFMDQNYAANMIITGPNAGGKTTSLMSLIINIIFAQAFGIAPSSRLILTAFSKVHSYLDITTNLQEGLSLFAAEVDRAKKLKDSIASCSLLQKTFTIIDEIFSGTDPKVAADVGFTFASQLAAFLNSMTIITTHFKELTGLEEKTGKYTNFKVADATINPDGSITYPFKLVPGISNQNIATQMLANQGLI
jgi:hypothetical protein